MASARRSPTPLSCAASRILASSRGSRDWRVRAACDSAIPPHPSAPARVARRLGSASTLERACPSARGPGRRAQGSGIPFQGRPCAPGAQTKINWTLIGPRGCRRTPMPLQKVRALQAIRESGRQDLNLRPPGPQPGNGGWCQLPTHGFAGFSCSELFAVLLSLSSVSSSAPANAALTIATSFGFGA
jgi:hypothetical protein